MKVSLALSIASASIVSASGAHVAVPQFVDSSTEQIVCSEPVRDTQPYYCFGAEYQDCSCWTETCGECLPQCCFKNKGNCPNNIDNAQCNVGPEEPPLAPTPTPPPFNRRAPSYCFVEPNYACYPNTSGRPGCCFDDGGNYCPSFQPGCQAQPRQPTGMNYCTYDFDYNCYPHTTGPTPKGGPPPPNTNPPGPNPRPPPPNDDKKYLRFKALKGIDS
ncbi:hypothetical protein ACHAWC_007833 [Mediolabrus comicus]